MDNYWKQRLADNSKERKALEFVRTVSGWCDIYGVEFVFVDAMDIPYPGERAANVAGYFDAATDSPTLGIAIGGGIDRWLPILVHEFCHLGQWSEQTELWKKSQESTQLADIDLWIAGTDYSDSDIESALLATRDMELECERRSVDAIKEYKLPIDIPNYIRGANAYILFHHVLKHTRKWCDRGPYRVPEITDKMPDTFTEYTGLDVSPELLELYKLHCYK